MPREDEDALEQVRMANDIVEVISEYVPLKRAGKNFKANSPFTQEKTPSFFVSPEKQLFHCFSSSVGGDVFSFVMRMENLTFPEALKRLADRAHIQLPERSRRGSERSGEKEVLYKIYEEAADYYHRLLMSEQGREARSYLKERGMDAALAKEFRIGWAPKDWRVLLTHLRKKGYGEDKILEAALVKKAPKGNVYDVFRGRVLFPIFNLQEKPVAFGGRILEKTEEEPKYLNSPEHPIFSKRRELFGLHMAKKHIQSDRPQLIVVEGYMDCMALYRHGIRNAVATLGTALAQSHARLLKRFTDEVIVLYDGDTAGQDAALRGLEVLLEEDLAVKLVMLPDGMDPDDYVKDRGREALVDAINSAQDLFDFKLTKLLKRHSPQDAMGVVRITNEMMDTFLKVRNSVLLSNYFRRLSETLRLDEESLRNEFRQLQKKRVRRDEKEIEQLGSREIPFAFKEEVLLLTLMFQDTTLRREGVQLIRENELKCTDSKMIFRSLQKAVEIGGAPSLSALLRDFEENRYQEEFVSVLGFLDEAADREKIFQDCLMRLKDSKREKRLLELREMIAEAEKEQKEQDVKHYLEEYQKLLKDRKLGTQAGEAQEGLGES